MPPAVRRIHGNRRWPKAVFVSVANGGQHARPPIILAACRYAPKRGTDLFNWQQKREREPMARAAKKTSRPQPYKPTVITKASTAFLERYINNPSPTGFEVEGQRLWRDYIKPFVDEVRVDNYGSVYGVINPKADFKVVIEAHADESFVHNRKRFHPCKEERR